MSEGLTRSRFSRSTFEPQIVAKNQTRWTGFDDKILSMYARGISTCEIEAHLKEIYGVDVSPTLISTVTDAVQEEVRAWQNRPLEPPYRLCQQFCVSNFGGSLFADCDKLLSA